AAKADAHAAFTFAAVGATAPLPLPQAPAGNALIRGDALDFYTHSSHAQPSNIAQLSGMADALAHVRPGLESFFATLHDTIAPVGRTSGLPVGPAAGEAAHTDIGGLLQSLIMQHHVDFH